MNSEQNNNIQLLKELFEEKKSRNSKYSLRAFSRDIDISVSHLSAMMNGNAKISTVNACKIAIKFDFPKEKFIDFITSTLH